MRDAYGGIVNLAILVVFLVLVNGYLAFNVNYTKAFRVKNKIITTLENYSGNCEEGSKCQTIIEDYENKIGYNAAIVVSKDKDTYCNQKKGYCIKKITLGEDMGSDSTTIDTSNKYYYKVTTIVNINIPIINRILPSIFSVSGNTNIIDPNLTK